MIIALQEIKQVILKCAVVKPGVYNLNRFRVTILDGGEDDDGQMRHHFVNEIRLPDDIIINVIDTDRGAPQIDLADQNLITFE